VWRSFEENAETECERFVNEALKYDPENPEVHQTMASLRISQNRKDDALKALNHSYQLWAEIGTSLSSSSPPPRDVLAMLI
jgi:cytochrome c-type biogenesis protein CcmH/NrfG